MTTRTNRPNVLLQKDDVGRSKPTTRRLPTFGFTYGRAEYRDLEGADKVVHSWKSHNTSKAGKPDKDFKNWNKASVAHRATTAHQMYEFRKTQEVRLKNKEGNPKAHIKLPEDDFSYGMPLRPSTPIRDVIGNYFGESAAAEMEYKNEMNTTQRNIPSKVAPAKATTKSQLQAQYIREKEGFKQQQANLLSSQGLFKMKKFGNVQPRTNTNNGRAKSSAGVRGS